MKYSYPLLEKVFEHYKERPHRVGDFYLVCCQHILEPQLRMFEYLISFGFNPDKIIVLGKAYSTNKEVLKEFMDRGIKAMQPEFAGISFDEEHRKNSEMVVNLIPKDAESIVIDDGAEIIKSFIHSGKNLIFAVEQTSSGFRRLESEKLSVPVINVARSNTKLVQESPFIARLCFERIKDFFEQRKIKNPTICVVGLGPIGEAIVEIFEQANFVVQGFDVKYGHSNLADFINKTKPDVIIGATGFEILTKEDVEKMANEKPLYCISVSSSDREFPVAYFRSGQQIHKDVVYKNIIFVNNGFPITFKGNRYEGSPIEMEKTMCLLGGSVMDAIVNGVRQSGLIGVSNELENLINRQEEAC